MPNHARGDVAPGYEMPVPGALVYLTMSAPAAVPQTAYCEQCMALPSEFFVVADAKGQFVIDDVAPGMYTLVIQKGQFRREQSIEVTSDDIVLPAAWTTLPNEHDPSSGQWTPRIALAMGAFDEIEAVLGKLGMGGSVNDTGVFVPAADLADPSSQVHLYDNGGAHEELAQGTLSELVADLELMKQYHMILIPCSGSAHTEALQSQENLRNIRDYVAAGGKLLVTDWSGVWADNVFPGQLQFKGADDTPAAAYDRASDTWDTTLFGSTNGGRYESLNAEVIHDGAAMWLNGQRSSLPGGMDTTIDATRLQISDNWNVIEALHDVEIGTDGEGESIMDIPTPVVIGGIENELPKFPLGVSYQPAGCGRVTYTTFHSLHEPHSGLYPQERLLAYLLMELGECSDR